MAFPSVIATSDQDDSGVNHTFSWPASGIIAGDLLLAFYVRGGNAPGGTPSGLTSLGADSVTNDVYARMYAKIATGSENGTTFTINGSLSDPGSCITYQIRGWSGSLAEIGVGASFAGATSTNPNPPTCTAPGGADDNLYIATAWMGSAVTASAAPTGFTNLITETNTGIGIASARDENTSASLNPGSFTASSSVWLAQTIVIQPLNDTIVTPTTASLVLNGNFPPTISIEYAGPRLLLEFTGLTQGNAGSGTSAVTASISPGANRAVILFIANQLEASNLTISGLSLTWNRITSVLFRPLFVDCEMHAFVAFTGGSPGSGTVTINFNGQSQSYIAWSIVDVEGADVASVASCVPQWSAPLLRLDPAGFGLWRSRSTNHPYVRLRKSISSPDNGVLSAVFPLPSIFSVFTDVSMSAGFGYTEIFDTAFSSSRSNIGVQARAMPERSVDSMLSDIVSTAILALEIAAADGRVALQT